MTELTRRTWAEIHLDRLAENYCRLRAIAPHSRFAGLVKANAYGHGALPVARKLEALGADYLLVACLDEALELREGGVRMPILILGYTPSDCLPDLLREDLTQTVYDPEQADELSRRALALGGRLRCHLKADTGMSRLGVLCNEATLDTAADTLAAMARLPGLEAEGLFMHFADADTSPAYSAMQIARFRGLLDRLDARGVHFSIRHCCAGAATLNYPEMHLDMVRPGILLFGHSPDHACDGKMALSPVMELKSRVASVKRLPAGTSVSYGCTYTLERESVVAAVPVGYADGLFRLLSNRQEMLVHGRRARQIGRVCMDMCMLDVTGIPDVRVGDVVTVFGDGIPLEEKADTLGTITYELLCAVSPRVKRVYLDA
ncbi:MAG TPA: alanine racemase [Candidatus Onthomonas avicola]|nr:alanine racemase [Candidatus Onthomonas avicola]